MSKKYILDGHKPIPCDDLMEWAKWFETAERHIADTKIGKVRISTVFLGLDYRLEGNGEPILFETMVFGGELDEETHRYTTWEKAEIGHKKMISKVKARQ